jgi:hypothetical protein
LKLLARTGSVSWIDFGGDWGLDLAETEERMKYSFLVLAGLGLVGCATSSTALNHVSVGMTKAQVVAIVGEPQSTRANQGVEYLIYKLGEGFSLHNAPHQVQDLYFVRITRGFVDSYGKVGDFNSTHPPEAQIDLNVNTPNP